MVGEKLFVIIRFFLVGRILFLSLLIAFFIKEGFILKTIKIALFPLSTLSQFLFETEL